MYRRRVSNCKTWNWEKNITADSGKARSRNYLLNLLLKKTNLNNEHIIETVDTIFLSKQSSIIKKIMCLRTALNDAQQWHFTLTLYRSWLQIAAITCSLYPFISLTLLLSSLTLCELFIYPLTPLFPSIMTYLLSAAVDEQVKGNSSHHVDEEPALKVVDRDTHRVAHHLIIDVHICCPEWNSVDYSQFTDINSFYN